ncbi:uncharacterized protein [Rutidosis leptorrhynchoides]|uniref:uncharacterized protein n=1 Tax=Rutidosis leptorrhynchoides TaxID=125765 RepID=UPI003A99E0A0
MEVISTSVPPSINLPKTHHLHHLKPPFLHHQNHHISTTKHHTSITSTNPTLSSHHKFTPFPSTSPPPPPPKTAHTHRNAATGYAAALVDAAICSNSFDGVYKDVKKLLEWLTNNEMLKDVMSDVLVDDGVKGRVMKEVVVNGKLRRQVVAMVKMLVAKNKIAMVEQVMVEFEKIYFDLNCVTITSSLKMVG